MKELDVNELSEEKFQWALKKIEDLLTSTLPAIAGCLLAMKEGQMEKSIPLKTLYGVAIKDLEDALKMAREAKEMWSE
ncbi:MAG TPA: hypothetical protein VN256_11875 [Pyrinomonadaceae bacterium]|nr:hypothetical protein [Pyrinomonadaceae bacterium]